MNADAILYIAAIVIALTIIKAILEKSVGKYRYKKLPFLLTKAELNFYLNLRKALPSDYGISCKVRMADVLSPAEKGKRYSRALTRIWAKHFDFVIYEMRTGKILSAVELDDRSHLKASRKQRDSFVNKIAQQCGLVLHRVRNKAAWSATDMAALLPETMKVNQGASPPPSLRSPPSAPTGRSSDTRSTQPLRGG